MQRSQRKGIQLVPLAKNNQNVRRISNASKIYANQSNKYIPSGSKSVISSKKSYGGIPPLLDITRSNQSHISPLRLPNLKTPILNKGFNKSALKNQVQLSDPNRLCAVCARKHPAGHPHLGINVKNYDIK